MSPTVTFQTPQDAGNRAVLQAAVESAIVPIDQRESADKPIEKERPAEIAQILGQPIEHRNSSGLKKLADYFKSLDEDYAADLNSLSQRVGERDQFVNQLPKVGRPLFSLVVFTTSRATASRRVFRQACHRCLPTSRRIVRDWPNGCYAMKIH